MTVKGNLEKRTDSKLQVPKGHIIMYISSNCITELQFYVHLNAQFISKVT